MLAAAITFEGAVDQHRCRRSEAGRLVLAVQLHEVGGGQIVQALEVGRHRGREGVEGDLLAAVGPERVAGDLREHLEAVHELDPGAGLGSLAADRRSRPAVLVGGEAAAGELAVVAHHRLVIPLGGFEELRVAGSA